MTYLSEHFHLAELTATSHRGIDNSAPPEIVTALTDTANRMERVRTLLGDRPVHINSGFRCLTLNRAVGGALTSAHLTGHAVDFIVPSFGSPLAVCRSLQASNLQFDQLIEEGSWVHLSFDPRMRRQVLTKNPKGGYVTGLAA